MTEFTHRFIKECREWAVEEKSVILGYKSVKILSFHGKEKDAIKAIKKAKETYAKEENAPQAAA
jgi:hypothetical protein